MARKLVLLEGPRGRVEITEAAWKNSKDRYEAEGYRQLSAPEIVEGEKKEKAAKQPKPE